MLMKTTANRSHFLSAWWAGWLIAGKRELKVFGTNPWRCMPDSIMAVQVGDACCIFNRVVCCQSSRRCLLRECVCKRVFVANWKAALRLLHIKAASLCRGHGSHASFQPALITPRSDEGQWHIRWNSGCHNGTGVHSICPDGRSVVVLVHDEQSFVFISIALRQLGGWTRAWSPSVAHQRDWRRSGYPISSASHS